MRASSTDHWRCNARPDRLGQGTTLAANPLLLAQFSTRVPPQLLERSPVAVSQLGLRRREVTEDGF